MGVKDIGSRQEQEKRHRGGANNSCEPSTSRGSQGGVRNQQAKAGMGCCYCGKKDHWESECWQKHTDSDKSGSSMAGQGSRKSSTIQKGRKDLELGTFVTKHKENAMKKTNSKLD